MVHEYIKMQKEYYGGGNSNPLQYSCLGDPMDREAQQTIIHGVTRAEHDLATKPSPPERVLNVNENNEF